MVQSLLNICHTLCVSILRSTSNHKPLKCRRPIYCCCLRFRHAFLMIGLKGSRFSFKNFGNSQLLLTMMSWGFLISSNVWGTWLIVFSLQMTCSMYIMIQSNKIMVSARWSLFHALQRGTMDFHRFSRANFNTIIYGLGHGNILAPLESIYPSH